MHCCYGTQEFSVRVGVMKTQLHNLNKGGVRKDPAGKEAAMAGKVTVRESTPEDYKRNEGVCLGMVIPCTREKSKPAKKAERGAHEGPPE